MHLPLLPVLIVLLEACQTIVDGVDRKGALNSGLSMLKLLMIGAVVGLVILLITREAPAQTPSPLEKKTFEADGKTLPIRLLTPAKVVEGQKYPLVIFLHGAGERGTDNTKQLVHGVPQFVANREKYPCFLIAPQCPDGKKWVEVDWSAASHTQPKEPSEPMKLLITLIERTIKDMPVDPSRVYLTGLSMGGYGTWDLAARRPELFAAIAPICGGADEATAEKIKSVPTWVFHGAKDPVVKPIRSQRMVEAIKKAGGNPKYTEYPNVAHDSWNPAYKDPAFYEWLFAQKK